MWTKRSCRPLHRPAPSASERGKRCEVTKRETDPAADRASDGMTPILDAPAREISHKVNCYLWNDDLQPGPRVRQGSLCVRQRAASIPETASLRHSDPGPDAPSRTD